MGWLILSCLSSVIIEPCLRIVLDMLAIQTDIASNMLDRIKQNITFLFVVDFLHNVVLGLLISTSWELSFY